MILTTLSCWEKSLYITLSGTQYIIIKCSFSEHLAHGMIDWESISLLGVMCINLWVDWDSVSVLGVMDIHSWDDWHRICQCSWSYGYSLMGWLTGNLSVFLQSWVFTHGMIDWESVSVLGVTGCSRQISAANLSHFHSPFFQRPCPFWKI